MELRLDHERILFLCMQRINDSDLTLSTWSETEWPARIDWQFSVDPFSSSHCNWSLSACIWYLWSLETTWKLSQTQGSPSILRWSLNCSQECIRVKWQSKIRSSSLRWMVTFDWIKIPKSMGIVVTECGFSGSVHLPYRHRQLKSCVS